VTNQERELHFLEILMNAFLKSLGQIALTALNIFLWPLKEGFKAFVAALSVYITIWMVGMWEGGIDWLGALYEECTLPGKIAIAILLVLTAAVWAPMWLAAKAWRGTAALVGVRAPQDVVLERGSSSAA